MRISDWSSDVCSSDLKDGDEWKTDTHWNRVTFSRQLAERAADLGKGDLVHITGRVRQNSYESNGETRYSVDLIAEGLGILTRGGAEIGRAHDRTPATYAHLACRLMLETKKAHIN